MTSLYELKSGLRHNYLAWRYALNFRPTLAYKLDRAALSPEGARVLFDLNKGGIAVTTAEALLGRSVLYAELAAEVEQLQRNASASIREARDKAGDATAIGQKTFIYFLIGEKPEVDIESVFARFALQQEILSVANEYMGMYSQLRYYNVWHTLASAGPARESQLWHRDRDDFLTCKVFLYLNDVDEGAGPFTYALGTHPKGTNHADPPYTLEGTVKRSDDDQMAVVAPRDTWYRATGQRGTLIFADTRGYHKGGEARTSDRLLYTCMFLSPASEVREMMTPPKSRFPAPSDPILARAMNRYAGRQRAS